MASGESRSPDAATVAITLSRADAQALYDHTGTIPYAPGSWSHNVRAELSTVLHESENEWIRGRVQAELRGGEK